MAFRRVVCRASTRAFSSQAGQGFKPTQAFVANEIKEVAKLLFGTFTFITGTTIMGGYAVENYKHMNPLTPPGQLVDVVVDGQKTTIHTRFLRNPESSVVVVVDGSAGETSFDFDKVIDKLGKFASVIAIDRPGLGYSSPGSLPRSISKEYMAVLAQLDVSGKLVLVGHGTGGYHMRQLASDLATSSATLSCDGLVLVDAPHEAVRGQMDAISPAVKAALVKREENSATLLRYSHWGLLRLVHWMQQKRNAARFTSEALVFVDSFAPSPPHRRGVAHEANALADTEAAFLQSPPAPLGCPLVVLSHETKDMFATMLFEPDVDAAAVATMEMTWNKGQCALLGLSPKAVHRVVPGLDIPHEKPEEFIAAVLAVVNEVQGKTEGGVSSLSKAVCPVE
ncbi:Equilibrative Nucleoside Transporter (ENT) Family [Achlya hypogyna]|uniref:Equilibrative Nucleoside Transporter (ENT) Family n=1 Tax=Achlya hypogyna TaxID=1202772 RepID=A0A1V9YKK8_ACHHY|nr:Equilibrative Nucleoside Transporter (ENT) Family [Achlya hypogyna]